MSQNKSDVTAYLLLLFVAVVWGGTWPLGRWMVTAADTIPPFMIAFIRYIFVIITFLIILILKENSLQFDIVKKHWKLMTFMGLISVTIYQAGYLFGEKYTSASDASLVIATGPIWVLLVAPFLEDVHIRPILQDRTCHAKGQVPDGDLGDDLAAPASSVFFNSCLDPGDEDVPVPGWGDPRLRIRDTHRIELPVTLDPGHAFLSSCQGQED